MKRNNTILLLVFQVTAVFIFSNIYALFKPLEVKEIAAVKEKADLMAELAVLKHKSDINGMKGADYFEEIYFEAGEKEATYTIKADKKETYVIKIPSTANRTLVFKKPVGSLILRLLGKLKKTFSTLSIVLGVFLIITGFYLVLLFKKEKKFDLREIPPLQDYLLKLKGSEMELKNIVEKQQESVTRQDELNKSIINNINAAVLFLNPAGRIDIFNRVAEELFSQSYANAKNNQVDNILSEFPEITRFIRENAAAAGNPSGEIESGGKIYSVDLIPVEKIGRLVIVKDITEEKNREKIDSRNKNFIMLGEMTAFLAHEIRNSLGVIYGYTRTLVPEKGDIEKAKLAGKVDKVNKEINFLSAMMESFLNFSKPIKVEKKEEIDLKKLLEKISAENDIAVTLPNEKARIENDKTLMCSVFSNLILNAKEAGADNIEFKISETKNKNTEIVVTDNGSGIGDKIREKIWYPFFTTKKKGTGMGLAMIRKVINSLNGDISLVKSGSRGATFKITLYN